MNVEQRQAAADPQTRPIDLGRAYPLGCYRLHPPEPFTITDTHFTIPPPRKVEA